MQNRAVYRRTSGDQQRSSTTTKHCGIHTPLARVVSWASSSNKIKSMPRVVAEATAPGKLILFGEHAVVYGATAVAAALSDLRVGVRVVRLAVSEALIWLCLGCTRFAETVFVLLRRHCWTHLRSILPCRTSKTARMSLLPRSWIWRSYDVICRRLCLATVRFHALSPLVVSLWLAFTFCCELMLLVPVRILWQTYPHQ